MGVSPQPPTVTFNYQTWLARYPEFSGVPEPLAQEYFNEASLYFANFGWTASLPQAPTLLNMLTAHIAQLNAPLGGQPSPQTVGRVASAGEGSVNVSLEYQGSGSPSQAWFISTKYGAAFWQAVVNLRSARYVRTPFPPPQAADLFSIPGYYGWGNTN